jgi:glycerophosphoryl diester phosphodiesterase
MKLIAHRGNVDGPNPLLENQPETIDKAIQLGFDVEIDIRYDTLDGEFYLGHDDPQYLVTSYWLAQRMENLWIHCKNIDALYHFATKTGGYNYFWHQEDDYTLTSKGYIWTYPGKTYTSKSIIVMPETIVDKNNLNDMRGYNCFGICSDFVGKLS